MKTVGELRAALRLLPDETRLVGRCAGDPKWVSIVGGKITRDNRPEREIVLILDVDPKKDAL